jgi:hypothetical protein
LGTGREKIRLVELGTGIEKVKLGELGTGMDKDSRRSKINLKAER